MSSLLTKIGSAARGLSHWIGFRLLVFYKAIVGHDLSDYQDRIDGNAKRWSDGFAFGRRIFDYLRVPIVVLVLATVIVFGVPQGRDIMWGISEGWRAWWLFGGVTLLSVSVWSQSRALLEGRIEDREYVDLPQWKKATIDWSPRVLGMWPVAIGVLSALHANAFVLALMLVGLGTILLGLYWARRREVLFFGIANPFSEERAQAKIFRAIWRVLCVFGWGLVILGVVAWARVEWGVAFTQFMGSAAVLFFGLAGINLALGAIVHRTQDFGFPVLGMAVFLYAVTSLVIYWKGDQHLVRATASPAPSHEDRATFEDAYESWRSRSCTVESKDSPYRPIVLVATAGGGLRASYFTARVLAELEERVPAFRRQVFAISGVSGGAVGAATWVSWLRAGDDKAPAGEPPSSCGTVRQSGQEWDELQSFFDYDYLAPVLFGLLVPDLVQRFSWPGFRSRAEYLERGWERGFRLTAVESGLDPNVMSGDFGNLGPPSVGSSDPWLPILLINGTHQQSGTRVLTTPIQVTPGVFPGAIDFYDTHEGNDLPVSTAAHNAARFPIFSPSGTLLDGSGHIIDGGYLENYGAATVQQLLNALERQVDASDTESSIPTRPIVIQIVNDADLPEDYGKPDYVPPRPCARGVFNEPMGPLFGLELSRQGRARQAGVSLAELARPEVYGLFRLSLVADEDSPTPNHSASARTCEKEETGSGRDPAPLGWVLSKKVRAEMDYQLLCKDFNVKSLSAIIQDLTGDDTEIVEDEAACEALRKAAR